MVNFSWVLLFGDVEDKRMAGSHVAIHSTIINFGKLITLRRTIEQQNVRNCCKLRLEIIGKNMMQRISKATGVFSAMAIGLAGILLMTHSKTFAQKLVYSVPEKSEARQTSFEIIGKYSGKYLVYKNYKSTHYISVYNTDMQLLNNVDMPYMPDRVIEASFVAYPDYSYLFYQFQKKGVTRIFGVKIGADGKNLTEPVELDTTHTGGGGNDDKIYSVIPSEDKSNILVFRVNTRNEKSYLFRTILLDKNLMLRHATNQLGLDMRDRNDFLTDFYVDNEGTLVFGRGLRPGPNENISKFHLVVKHADADTFAYRDLDFQKITLDEVKLKMDNYHQRYLFTGFYYSGKKSSIEGIANAVFDKKTEQWTIHNVIPLNDELREDARSENNAKNAFNDYYIHDITIRSDGVFLVNAESVYQTTHDGNNYNRWNYMNPWTSPMDYYRYGGYYGGYGSPWGYSSSNTVRYHADNILALAFDKDGKLFLSNVVRKSQYDDNTDNMVSYALINTGNGLQYLYNDYEKRETVLAYQTIVAGGRIIRNPTIKGLERDYDFLPRYAKQVDTREVIIPCLFRNTLCFARLEFP